MCIAPVKIKKLLGTLKYSVNGKLAVITYVGPNNVISIRPFIKYSSELTEHESKIFKGYLADNKII